MAAIIHLIKSEVPRSPNSSFLRSKLADFHRVTVLNIGLELYLPCRNDQVRRDRNAIHYLSLTCRIDPLRHYALTLFPGFQALDVFGPIDTLNFLSQSHPELSLSILSHTLDPVPTKPPGSSSNTSFSQSVLPTHTYASPPETPIDVLIIPGGLGARLAPTNDPTTSPLLNFVKSCVPSVKEVITVCTGAGLLAQTGHLDGKRATTNKARFDTTAKLGPNVHWVRKARWVNDGRFWTSAGVSAGIDVALAFIAHHYGRDEAVMIAQRMEYDWHEDADWDPFSEIQYPK